MKNLFILEHHVVVSAERCENEKNLASRMILEIYFYESFNVFFAPTRRRERLKNKGKFQLLRDDDTQDEAFFRHKMSEKVRRGVRQHHNLSLRTICCCQETSERHGVIPKVKKKMMRWLPANFSPAFNHK